MLTLRTQDYRFTQVLESANTIINNNWIVGSRSVPGVGYVNSAETYCSAAPIKCNDIDIDLATLGISDEEDLEQMVECLELKYNHLPQKDLGIYKVYTSDVVNTASKLGELYCNVDTAVQSLYNKCMEQVVLREEREGTAKIIVKTMKGKHGIVIITDTPDVNQASDWFLTIGLIPIIFKDWKEKFNDEEMAYFKALVNRSQVKRISNVNASAAFNTMMDTDKYKEMYETIRMQLAIDNIVSVRIDTARRALSQAQDKSEDLMRQYDRTRRLYYQTLKEVNNLESTKDQVRDEIRLAIKMEGIIDVKTYDSSLIMCIRAPFMYYDTDEVECAIKNWREDSLAYKLVNAVFVEQKYKLWVYNEFTYNFNPNESFHAPSSIDYADLNRNKALFNPHTFFYNCLGDYKPQLIEAQSKGDLLLYNNIAVASTKSINFKDGAVINRFRDFINEIQTYSNNAILNIPCLEDEEGKLVSIYEAFIKPPDGEIPVIEVEEL